MSSPSRRSFLARSAALAAVPTVAMLAEGTLTGQASATLADSAPVPPSALPLTDRHLTRREKETSRSSCARTTMARVIPWTPRGSGICSQRTVCSTASAVWRARRACGVRN